MVVRYLYENVTSTVSMLVSNGQGDGIVIHVVNDSNKTEKVSVVIYQNTGAGASVVVDKKDVDIIPSWAWGLGYTVKDSGEYWVRIRMTSESLISKVSFERVSGGIWNSYVTYNPGDFAVFKLAPARKRIW